MSKMPSAIRHVLDASRLAPRHPGHPRGDARLPEAARLGQESDVDARDARHREPQRPLRSQDGPIAGVEDDFLRGQQFLECPATRKPSAPVEIAVALLVDAVAQVDVARYVGQVGEADLGTSYQSNMELMAFGELDEIRLVDAACVNP